MAAGSHCGLNGDRFQWGLAAADLDAAVGRDKDLPPAFSGQLFGDQYPPSAMGVFHPPCVSFHVNTFDIHHQGRGTTP